MLTVLLTGERQLLMQHANWGNSGAIPAAPQPAARLADFEEILVPIHELAFIRGAHLPPNASNVVPLAWWGMPRGARLVLRSQVGICIVP